MKKTKTRLLSLMTAFMLVISLTAILPEGWLMTAGASTYTIDDTKWTYEVLNDNTLAITAVSLSEATIASHNVTMPSYINGVAVTEIRAADNATNIFGATDLKISNVDLPSNLKTIGDNTFNGCSQLVSVTQKGSQITTIGNKAFYNCPLLNSFGMPSGLESIGEYAFAGCVKLPYANMPDTVKTVGKYAFSGCTALEEVTVSRNVEKIEEGTFKDCNRLAAVSINNYSFPSKLKSIGKKAFYDCDGIKAITLPDALEYIYENAFYDCDGLEYVVLPEGVKSIGENAFADGAALKAIYIPEGTTVKNNAISGLNTPTVYGYTGSFAEIEADDMGYTFVDVDEMLEDIYTSENTIYTVISSNNTSGNPYVTLSGKNVSGRSITGLGYNAKVNIVPLNMTTAENISVGHYQITTRLKFNDLDNEVTTNDWIYNTAYYEFGTSIYTGVGIGRLDKNTITKLIRAKVINGEVPHSAQGTIIVTPIFEEAGNAYALTVAGKQVTDVNCNDVFGDGIFSYDNKTKTLTINSDVKYSGAIVYNSGIKGLTVNIPNDCSLSSYEYSCFSLAADTTITGNGKLKLYSETNTDIMVRPNVTVTIKDADITMSNNSSNKGCIMKYNDTTTGAKVIFDNSYVNIKENKAASSVNEIVLSNCRVVSPIGGYVKEGQIVYKDNGTEKNAAKVTIEPSTSLPGDADDNGYVDLLDVMLMQQYIAKWNVDINPLNADVDGDGDVTIVDVMLVQQQIAGWSVL